MVPAIGIACMALEIEASKSRFLSSLEKIPRTMAEKFSAITALTNAFCEKHLNEEYRALIHRVVGTLATRRPSPLLKGKENVWVAGAVHAVGITNFLYE